MKYDQAQVIDGKETSYLDFKGSFEVIETHEDSSHDTRQLMKRKDDGGYWLYDYHEEMNFSGGDDYSYEHWFKLDDVSEWMKYKELGVFTMKADLKEYYYSQSPSFAIHKK